MLMEKNLEVSEVSKWVCTGGGREELLTHLCKIIKKRNLPIKTIKIILDDMENEINSDRYETQNDDEIVIVFSDQFTKYDEVDPKELRNVYEHIYDFRLFPVPRDMMNGNTEMVFTSYSIASRNLFGEPYDCKVRNLLYQLGYPIPVVDKTTSIEKLTSLLINTFIDYNVRFEPNEEGKVVVKF